MTSNPSFSKSKPFLDSSTSLQRDNPSIWSFPKAERFRKIPSNSVPLLELPSTISTRFTTLGKGSRSNPSQNANPGPDLYNLPSQFDPLSRKAGIFFGSEPRRKIRKPEIRPGPATYEINRSLIRSNKGVKLKSRHSSLNSTLDNPGPNAYQVSEKSVKKNRFSGISLGRGKRYEFYHKRKFYADNVDVPGPGSYNLASKFDCFSTPVLRNKLCLSQVHKLSDFEMF
jgi:hypothetical protein